jgi:hypothetical protein
MPRIVIGARVRVDGKPATVTAHRQKGMVDVRVDGETYDMRKVEATLGRLNPGRTDLYDPDKEQFHAVVQGIYESLMAKHLRVASIHSTRQGVRRADVRALEKGSGPCDSDPSGSEVWLAGQGDSRPNPEGSGAVQGSGDDAKVRRWQPAGL